MVIQKVSQILENDCIGRRQEIFMSLFLLMKNKLEL